MKGVEDESVLPKQGATDDELLDLGGAFVKAQQSHIALKALHWVLIDVARAAVNLHTAVGHAAHHLGAEQFGAGHTHGNIRIGQVCRFGVKALRHVLHQRPTRQQFRLAVGQHGLD